MSEPDPVRQQRRELGRRLAAARTGAGLSQREFARRISYARSTVSTVESGVQRAGPSFWEACDRALRTGGTFARSYGQLRQQQAAARHERAPRSLGAGPGASGLRAARLADALAAYQALGWPVTTLGETAQLATGTALDALEVPKAAGTLAACWWRHASGTTCDVPLLPDPTRALAVIACGSSLFFLVAPGCYPWHASEPAGNPPRDENGLVIWWHSSDSGVPAPPSADRGGHHATWAYLPAGEIELACPVILLGLLAKASAAARTPGALTLAGSVLAVPATSHPAQPGLASPAS